MPQEYFVERVKRNLRHFPDDFMFKCDLIRLNSNKRAQTFGGDHTKKGLAKICIGSIVDFYQKGSCRNSNEHYKTSNHAWFNPN